MKPLIVLLLTTSCLQFKESIEVRNDTKTNVKSASVLTFKTPASSLDSRTYYNFSITDLKSKFPSVKNMTIFSSKREVRIKLDQNDISQTKNLSIRGFKDKYFAKVVTAKKTVVLQLKMIEGNLTF